MDRDWVRRARRLVEEYWAPVLVLTLAFVAVLPALTVQGIVATRAGGDSPFLLQRVHQMAASIAALDLPARWMPDAAYGLGYPFWNYYAPLAYLVAGGIAVLGGGVIGAIKVTTLLWFLLAALGAYRLGRSLVGTRASGLLAAAAYTFAPYHMINVYVRGDALSELAAYAVVPWVLLAIDRAVDRRDAGSLAWLAVVFGFLAISHTISAMLFAPVVVLYAVWRLLRLWRDLRAQPRVSWTRPPSAPVSSAVSLGEGLAAMPGLTARLALVLEHWTWSLRWRPGLRALLAVLTGLTLGAGLAAWYWLPAMAESSAVQLGENLTGYFDYAGHFRSLLEIVPFTSVVEYAVEGAARPWSAGLLQVVLALCGALVGLSVVRRRGSVVFWGLVAIVATLLITGLSAPLWRLVGPMAFAQFPWRWLTVQSLALAMLAAPLGGMRRGRLLAIAASLALMAAAMARLPVETLPVSEVTRSDIATFELFSANIGSTVRSEYLPAGVAPRPVSSVHVVQGRKAAPRAASPGGTVDRATLIHSGTSSQEWEVETSGVAPITIAFPVYGFPGWTARVRRLDAEGATPIEGGEGRPPQVASTVDGSGWLTVDLPNGRYRVVLKLERSDVRALAEGLSLLAFVVLLLFVLVDRHPGWRRALIGTIAVILVAVLAARFMPRATPQGPVTLDFERMPYPHYNPDGMSYGPSRLRQADLLAPSESAGGEPTVEAGSTLDVVLRWEDEQPDWNVELALVSPAEVQHMAPDVLATSRLPQGGNGLHRIEVPPDSPSGLYFVRLAVSDAAGDVVAPVNADGYGLERVYLGPVRVLGSGDFRDRPERPAARFDGIVLHAVQSVQHDDQLEVRMFWEADREQVRDYKVSVRLLDLSGEVVASDDKMTGYGFSPTTAWLRGEQVLDRRWLDIEGLEPGDDYRIEVVLYDARHVDEPLGNAQVGGVSIK
jgi:cytochrome b subunit of formate dehydrogenase